MSESNFSATPQQAQTGKSLWVPLDDGYALAEIEMPENVELAYVISSPGLDSHLVKTRVTVPPRDEKREILEVAIRSWRKELRLMENALIELQAEAAAA